MRDPACVSGNGKQFIAGNPETRLRTGLELDQAALERRVQAKLPQSVTGVEFKKQ
jgi:hypothetical protein